MLAYRILQHINGRDGSHELIADGYIGHRLRDASEQPVRTCGKSLPLALNTREHFVSLPELHQLTSPEFAVPGAGGGLFGTHGVSNHGSFLPGGRPVRWLVSALHLSILAVPILAGYPARNPYGVDPIIGPAPAPLAPPSGLSAFAR